MNTRGWMWLVVLGLVGMVTAGCATMMAEKPTLYERLGGKEEIHKLVDDFVGRLAKDPSFEARFTNSPRLKRYLDAKMPPPTARALALAPLQAHLAEQICEAAGGPCGYVGKSMNEAHAGMGITSAEFDATVKHFVASLDKFKVPEDAKTELLAILGSLKKDIVEK